MDDLIDTKAAAALSGYSARHIKTLFHAGELPGVQDGRGRPIRLYRKGVLALAERRPLLPVGGLDSYYAYHLGFAVNTYKDENGDITAVLPARLDGGRVELNRDGKTAVWVPANTLWPDREPVSPPRIRPAYGHPGYFVCETAVVISARRGGPHLVKPRLNHKGCEVVALRTRTVGLSRLVFESFVGPIPYGADVRHLNRVKTDHRLENLAVRRVARKPRLSRAAVLSLRRDHAGGKSLPELARAYGVSLTAAWRIVRRRVKWAEQDA
jgi:hypothetical protein